MPPPDSEPCRRKPRFYFSEGVCSSRTPDWSQRPETRRFCRQESARKPLTVYQKRRPNHVQPTNRGGEDACRNRHRYKEKPWRSATLEFCNAGRRRWNGHWAAIKPRQTGRKRQPESSCLFLGRVAMMGRAASSPYPAPPPAIPDWQWGFLLGRQLTSSLEISNAASLF